MDAWVPRDDDEAPAAPGLPTARRAPHPRVTAAILMVGAAIVVAIAVVVWRSGGLSADRIGQGAGSLFGGGGSSASQASVTVEVFEFGFNPDRATIRPGEAVAWKAVGKELHTIKPLDRSGDAVFLEAARKGTARHVFREPGIYRYYCSIHPRMRGQIVVR